MILECAVLDVKPDRVGEFEKAFAEVQRIIAASPAIPTVEHYEGIAP